MNESNLFDPASAARCSEMEQYGSPLRSITRRWISITHLERYFISTALLSPREERAREIIQLNLANFRDEIRDARCAHVKRSRVREGPPVPLSAGALYMYACTRYYDTPTSLCRRDGRRGRRGGSNYRASCSAFLGPALAGAR
jgi:hypothetical protein